MPNANATTPGNDNSGLPLNQFFSIEAQTVIDPDQFPRGPIYITGIAFRAAPGTGTLTLTGASSYYLSTSPNWANSNGHSLLSTTLANNIGPDNTLVYSTSGGTFTAPGCAVPGPCPFGAPIVFSAPFLYNPANGPLLIDQKSTSFGAISGQIDIQDCTPTTCAVAGVDVVPLGGTTAKSFEASGTIMQITYTPATQTTTNVTLNLTAGTTGNYSSNSFNIAESGSAGALGYATLYITSTQPVSGGSGEAPIQLTGTLYFDQLDSIVASFTENDVNFSAEKTFTLSGGTITGGTGAYTGATGSLNLTFNLANNVYTTTGNGSVTVAGQTTPLSLTNFQGSASSQAQEGYSLGTASGTASPLGNATANFKIDNINTPPAPSVGTITVTLNSTDSFSLFFSVAGLGQTVLTFPATVSGGTGAYAGATGSFTLTLGKNSSGTITFTGSGTLTTTATGAPIITSVKTAFGLPVVAYNTWLQINGINLAPASTPAGGVVWSTAPSFAQNMMPSQLGNISVTVDGLPGYIFFYCSALTDAACTSGDQINVLAPLDTNYTPYPVQVVVTNNGVSSAPFTVLNAGLSPTFPLFDATGHVVARHLNFNLLGPTSLFPGSSTPATPGETIILVLYGLGPPSGTALTAGSATQTGSLPNPIQCWISGQPATVVALELISPGLYQLNITVPANAPAGDNPITCNYFGFPTFPGALINVQ